MRPHGTMALTTIARLIPLLVLPGMLFGACKVNEHDVEEWKGTVRGPGKIVAVMLADKYDLELRSAAALALVEMQRQDVNGTQELQKGLQQLDSTTRAEILGRMLPGLEKLMKGAEAAPGAATSPQQIRAKDAAFSLVDQGNAETRKRLTALVIGWYAEDFNGRSLAGNYSAEQVVRGLGSPAAAALVDVMGAKMPQQALVKLAELIGQVGDERAKQQAAERLVAILEEMESDVFIQWLVTQIKSQLEASDQKVDDERIARMADVNQHLFIVEGALSAMKHLAGQPAVAERLLAVASTAGDERVTERRTRALQALEGRATAEHLEILLKLALDSANPISVRDYAFDRVGDIRSPAAIPPMWPLVQNDKDPRLRWRAGELVLAIGGPDILTEFLGKLPATRGVAYDPQELEGYATRWGQMNPMPRQVAAAQLRAPDWWKRVLALKFFERKGDESDVASMQALVNDAAGVVGEGWPKEHTVGKVAESAIAALRQRLKQGADGTPEGL